MQFILISILFSVLQEVRKMLSSYMVYYFHQASSPVSTLSFGFTQLSTIIKEHIFSTLPVSLSSRNVCTSNPINYHPLVPSPKFHWLTPYPVNKACRKPQCLPLSDTRTFLPPGQLSTYNLASSRSLACASTPVHVSYSRTYTQWAPKPFPLAVRSRMSLPISATSLPKVSALKMIPTPNSALNSVLRRIGTLEILVQNISEMSFGGTLSLLGNVPRGFWLAEYIEGKTAVMTDPKTPITYA